MKPAYTALATKEAYFSHLDHTMAHQIAAEELLAEISALQFPQNKKEIARLSHGSKMEWYAAQFQKDPQAATVMLSSKEFESFWKWRVVIPMRIKRMYFRIKNFEVFKRYPHISEMKKKVKPYSV